MELMLIIETIICIILLLLLVRSNRKQTSYKAREAKIIDSQQFCLNILDNLPFPVFVKDINDDFRYKLWNKEAERKSGTTREEILGHSDFEIYGKERGRKYRQIDEQLVKNKVEYQAEDDYVTPDGTIHNTIVNKSVITLGNNHWLLVVRWDITQIKEYEKKLIQAKEELAEFNLQMQQNSD